MKTYGYRRSGNNLLIQTLIKNFEFDNLEKIIHSKKEVERFKNTFTLDDEISNLYKLKENNGQWNHPYAKLDGGHGLTSQPDRNGIYIIRNPRDVMLSLYNLRGFKLNFEDWCDRNQLDIWKNHVNHFVNLQDYFYIRYEDLVNNFEPTIKSIHTHFKLKLKKDSYQKVDKLVGWGPKKGKLEGRTRTANDFPDKMNKIFKPYVNFYETL